MFVDTGVFRYSPSFALSSLTPPSQTEETPEELNHRMIMLPDQPIKLRWDVAISMVCVLVSVLTPFRMAFAHIDSLSWIAFDAVVDVLFVFGETHDIHRPRLVLRPASLSRCHLDGKSHGMAVSSVVHSIQLPHVD